MSAEITPTEWMSVKEAAKLLGGVSDKLVYKLYHQGELEGAKIAGAVRIRKACVMAYLEAHSNKKAPPDEPTGLVVDRPPAVTRKRRNRKPALGFIHLRPRS